MQHRPKAVLFFLFFVTVLIRIPQLTRPLSKHHELNTAAVLTCLQVWNGKGIAFSHGAPVHMFPGTHNIFRNPNSPYPNLFASGTYLSMGPGSYLLPWATFKILHIAPSETSLRVFMLMLQLLTVFLFYALIQQGYKTVHRRNLGDPKTLSFDAPYYHLLAVAFFLFSPAVMWFMGNAYSHEIMAMPLYLAALLTGFKIIGSGYKWGAKKYMAYSFIIAAAVYTDWLGCVIALVFFLQAFSLKQFKNRLAFLCTTAIAVSIPLALIVWQYSSVIGMAEYKKFFLEQLFNRRTPDGDLTYSGFDLLKHFFTGYGLFFIAAIAGLWLSNAQWNRFLLVLLSVPVLHYLLFRGFSNEHDYSVLKWAPIVITWAVFCLIQLKKKVQTFTIVIMVCFSVFLYEYLNPPGQQSFNGEQYAWMQQIGVRLAAEARPDEYVFINTPSYYYQIGWYAKRNYLNVASEAEARLWLSYQTGSKAIYYQLGDENQVLYVTHLTK